jgi:hypothetical protein
MKEVGLLPNGSMLFVEDDRDTGRRYWSDEIGGGVVVWDTTLIDKTTLLAAIVAECRLEYDEYRAKTKVESKSIG